MSMKHLRLLIAVLVTLVVNVDAAKPLNVMVFLIDDMGVMDTSVPFLTDKAGEPKRYPLNNYYRTPGLSR